MESNVSKKIVLFLALVLFSIIALGLFWLFSYKGTITAGDPNNLGLFWWIFSFAAGLSMIVLPCTLPLAFVIVPLSMGRGIVKGLGMALSFGLGIALTLSLYGVVAAILGKFAIGALGSDAAETIKNWVYFIAGIFALVFALSEIGLMKFRMPTYTGAMPAFIQKRQDYLKALLLGLFLGNIGIGCPHPATPLIFVEIASSGNVLYGWLLFLVHAIGRVLPLIFLALLGIMGVNGLSWLVARKDKVEKATGWAMVFVAGFILTLGLFSHDWWVNSGIHTQFEKLTQEESLLNIVKQNIGSTITHHHGIETGTGLFGLPLWLGNWALVFLWVFPIWWWWFKEKKRVSVIPDQNQIKEKDAEHSLLMSREKFFTTLTIVLALIFIYILPHNFLKHEALEDMHGSPTTSAPHSEGSMFAQDVHDISGQSSEPTSTMEGMMMSPTILYEETNINNGLTVNLTTIKKPFVGKAVPLTFFVNEKPSGIPVDDLQIEHEKYMHVVGVRDDLTNFFHIHPIKTKAGTWEVSYEFKEGGTYKVWSDIARSGKNYSFGHPLLLVGEKNSTTTPTKKESIDFLTNRIIGNYQVALDYNAPLVKGINEKITFTVKDLYGNGIELEPYIGASMHLVAISEDLTEYIHAHPEDGHMHMGNSESVSPQVIGNIMNIALAHGDEETPAVSPSKNTFNVVFPKQGIYKLFAQFRPKGIDLPPETPIVGEFYVKVANEGNKVIPSTATKINPQTRWWSLLIISLFLMTLLSYGVHKILQVK